MKSSSQNNENMSYSVMYNWIYEMNYRNKLQKSRRTKNTILRNRGSLKPKINYKNVKAKGDQRYYLHELLKQRGLHKDEKCRDMVDSVISGVYRKYLFSK